MHHAAAHTAHAVADVDEAAGHLFQEKGEVFAGRHGLGLGHQAGLAQPVAHKVQTEGGLGGVVHEDRVAAHVVHLDRGTVSLRLGSGDLVDAPLQQVANFGLHGPHAQPQLGCARDHVGRVACQKCTQRNDAGLQGWHVARNNTLQGHDNGRAHEDGVNRIVRKGRMAAHALDGDDAGVCAGHGTTGHGHELAFRNAGAVVHAKHGIAGKQVQETVFEHLAGTAQTLFGGLEHGVHDAVEVSGGRQMACRRQQHGGVAVMATSVHLAKHLAGPGLARGFGNRQGVHVGTQADAACAGARTQGADHARATQAAVHLPAPAFKSCGHQVTGVVLLKSQLGVGVDLVADVHHLGFVRTDGF